MSVNRRHHFASWPRRALLAAALLVSVLTVPIHLAAQTQFNVLPGCQAPPPPPDSDTYPFAATDSLQTASAPLVFTGATLLANDRGTSLTMAGVAGASSAGGVITGTGPYTYTPPAGFLGTDAFAYKIRDSLLQTAVGVVKVSVTADLVAPTVSITAPTGGTVSGNVLVVASASDNGGVAGVKFFDGAAQIGAEATSSPYQVTWATGAVANGSHTLTAVARDGAGNTATSSPVPVNVSNVVLTAPVVERTIFSDGSGKRTTAAFSTTHTNDVLVAFASSDGPASANSQTITVSGAGLTWTRVRRVAGSFGDSEIWTATAPSLLTNVTVSSTQSSSSRQSLTVVVFAGSAGVGASAGASAATGAASASLVTSSVNSLVYAVGNDWDSATARTLPTGQVKVHEAVDTTSGDTFWVQATSAAIAATGTTVAMSTSSPTLDQWNFAAVEIKAGVVPPPPPPVTVPSVVGLTQSAAQTAITGAGLTVGTITTANSSTVPSGSVISQNPTGGTSAPAGSAVALTVSLGPTPPAAPPVLAMSFNEVSGSTATDSSGNGNNGTISGATRVTGQVGFGGALQFNGTSSIVNVAHSASLALTSGMTLEAWVNPSANAGVSPNDGWRTVIMKERGTTGLAYGLYGNDGNTNPSRPAGYIRNNNSDVEATAGPALPVGVWTHVAVTYDGTSIRLYVNGQLRSTQGASGGIAASTAPLRIGGNTVFSVPGTEYFAGLIDEVRIYNRALSAAEITTDMNTPLP
jgi:concanavalin A-like lectin/glucanase superfamily protein/Big-like domain-containing protein/PASTA domain-containing protein